MLSMILRVIAFNFFISIQVLLPSLALATEYIVDNQLPAGDCTSNNYHVTARNCTGSWGNAYDTIQEVLDILVPGDFAYIRSGSVYPKVNNQTGSPGTAANRITIMGCPVSVCGTNERPIIMPGVHAGPAFNVPTGVGSYYTYQRLEIDSINNTCTAEPGNEQDPAGIQMRGTGVIVDDIWMKNAGCTAFGAHVGDSLLIKNSWVYGWSRSASNANGLYIAADFWTVQDTLFEKSGSSSVGTNALWINKQSGGGDHGVLERSTFIGANTTSWITTNASDIIIRNNISHGGRFVQIGYPGTGGTSNIRVVNNTLFADTSPLIDLDIFGGVSLNAQIKNNIVVCANTSIAPYRIDDAGTIDTMIQTNIFRNCGTGVDNGTGTVVSGTITSDPLFIDPDPVTGDYHLQAGSPAINVGITLADVSDDFDTNSRPQGLGYEIGAYEVVEAGGTLPKSLRGTITFHGTIEFH